MSSIAIPDPSFHANVADLYGDDRPLSTPTTAVLPADPIRAAYRAAVDQVAANAKAVLPDSAGRIDSAVKLVLAGDVELCADGTARIASQSHGVTAYFTMNGTCDCKDFAKAPAGQCKHRLARGIATRAHTLASAMLDMPEATDAHATCSNPEQVTSGHAQAVPPTPDTAMLAPYIVQIHGKAFVQYAGLLALAHSRGLQRLEASFISVTADLALAQATATFADGRVFHEVADATPENVGAKIRPHFARMAATRAKARALRDALCIDLCSVEELD